VDLGRRVGHEQENKRPALIVSNDSFNRHSKRLTICPFTSNPRQPRVGEIEIHPPSGGLQERSLLLVDQLTTISILRVSARWGRIEDPVMQRRIDSALLVHMGLPGALG